MGHLGPLQVIKIHPYRQNRVFARICLSDRKYPVTKITRTYLTKNKMNLGPPKLKKGCPLQRQGS